MFDAQGTIEEALIELVSTLCCQHCGNESLRLTDEFGKRSWSKILHRDSQDSPGWYRESQEKDDIRFWDDAMGEGFSEWYAWYLKSTMKRVQENQNHRPGWPNRLRKLA